MPKQELLVFIQKKLREGVSQDDIIYKLTSHGWPLVEIHEGFNYLTVMSSEQSFQEPASFETQAPKSNNQLHHSPVYSVSRSREFDWFFNPTLFQGLLAVIIGSLAGVGSFFFGSMSTILGVFVAVSLVVSIVGAIISGLLLHLITRILDISGRSMGKAFMFTGATLIGMFVLNLTMLIGVPGYIMFLLTLIGGFAFFYYYYEVTFLKTLAVLGLGIVFSVVVSILLSVIGFTLGIGLFGQLFSSGSNLREMTGSSMNNIQFDMPIDQY